MTDEQAKHFMSGLAAEGSGAVLPEFDRVWAMRRLEQEFEQRRRAAAPLLWIEVALQTAAGLAVAALLTWWGTLS